MLRRLGFPVVGSHRRFVSAVGIDAVGSGVWLPLSVLYFLGTTDVSLARIGLALSVAAVLVLPSALLAGHLVDAYGARRTLQCGHLLQVLGFASYLLAHDPLGICVVATITGVGRSMFFGAYAPMVAAISERGERETWFGLLNALRNVGFAVGGLAASVALTVRTEDALHAVVLLNAASYLVAFVLVSGVRVAQAEAVPTPVDERVGGWRDVLVDSGYRWLVVANLCYALIAMALNLAVPAYVVDSLGLPGWVSAAAYVANTVLVGLGQGLVVRALTGWVRWRTVALSASLSALAFAGFLLAGGVGPAGLAIALVLGAVVVYTLGEMTGGPVLATLAAEAPPTHLRGRYQTAFGLSWNAAAVIAPALYLSLLDAGRWPVWVVLGAIAVLGAACSVPLGRRMPAAAGVIRNRAEAVEAAEVSV